MSADPVRVVCLQLACPDEESAADRVRRVLAELRRVEADLVVLPELWATGFFHVADYDAQAEPLTGPTLTALREVARERGFHLVAGSLVERADDGALHNTAVLVGPGGDILHTYRKVHLFGHDGAETRLLTPGTDVRAVSTELGRIGLATCYDLRFPELFRQLADDGAELVAVVSAWPAARVEHWRVLARARAIENQTQLVACNLAGRHAGRELAGTSLVIDAWGTVLAEGDAAPGTVVATLDRDGPATVRAAFPVLTDRRLGFAAPTVGVR
ncbi:carbon-nitrogen family hydrolase [Frankia sp. AgPm24]|uniref:carbon-nitrogen family hydrolase n=1 Tax=Frankia sp. AgPm24 TaxID=631128 RepID=UPI00200E89D2|nr:carbon-nitrogen family hydrolase [Frankia sp. AgPm24]MCK9920373.1 carbon-nitrogen family hydrolase [Frankia sp. AgPm24]